MSGRKASGLVLSLTATLWLAAAAPAGAEPARRFAQSCSGCHSVGEGDRAGPDLLGVTRLRDRVWLEAMIREPSRLFARADPLALELLARFGGARMPDQPLSDGELAGLLEWLEACSAKGGCGAEAHPRRGSEAEVSEIEVGRLLFEGRRRFGAGAPHCAICHHLRGTGLAGGGTLGPDLTFAYARLGDARLSETLERPAAAPMRRLYAERPLEADEAFRLRAWLAASSRGGAPPVPDHTFPLLGSLLFVLALAALRTARAPASRSGGRR